MADAAATPAPGSTAAATSAGAEPDTLAHICARARLKSWYHSPVPECCRAQKPVYLGIDEAGRGPVLGDMTYACAYWPGDRNDALGALGFDDSKALSAEKRQSFFQGINAHPEIGFVLRVISAKEISENMLQRTPRSLNQLSHQTAVDLVQHALDRGVNVTHVFVDTVGDAERYQAYLSRVFHHRLDFTVTSKADSIYPVVSAASIVAKVARDRLLDRWQFKEKSMRGKQHDFGCGYPGDKITKAWLQENLQKTFGYPDIVRFSWQTTKTILQEQAHNVNWFDESDYDPLQPKISFSVPATKRRRASYFRANDIGTVETFD